MNPFISDAQDLLASEMTVSGKRVAFAGKMGGMNRKEAKALVRKHGGMPVDRVDDNVDLIVIGADHLDIEENDNHLFSPAIANAAGKGRIRVINETELWQWLGLVDTDTDVCQLYTPAMLARLLEVPIASIRRWHRRGLIKPTRMVHRLPYFDFAEVASARRIARLIAAGASPTAIESKLSRLAELNLDLQRPLAQLSIIVDGRSILLRQEEGLVEPGGQRHFDFEASEESDGGSTDEQVLSMEIMDSHRYQDLDSPEQFIQLAVEMEDADQLDSAIEVYRALALAFGPTADVNFRLAELLYQTGDLPGSRERYFAAIELEPSFVEARASLGCVLVEMNQPDLAVPAFRGALEHHEDYPDVHFHLAGVLEELGRFEEAMTHWQRFLELAPKSPWAEEAQARLDRSKQTP